MVKPLKRRRVSKQHSANTFKKDITSVKLVNMMPANTSRGGIRF